MTTYYTDGVPKEGGLVMTEQFDKWAIDQFGLAPGLTGPAKLSEIHHHLCVFVQEVERRASEKIVRREKAYDFTFELIDAYRELVRDFGLEDK